MVQGPLGVLQEDQWDPQKNKETLILTVIPFVQRQNK